MKNDDTTEQNEDRDEGGKFLPGNTVWQTRESFGRTPVYEDSETLWQACCGYFSWAYENPLYEAKVLASGQQVPFAKMRAFTQRALCLHLRISDETWRDWRSNRSDLREVILTVDSVIFTQKFEGAAAGLLNPNLIARDLGLAEKQQVEDTTPPDKKTHSSLDTARAIMYALHEAMREQKEGLNENGS